MIHLVGKKAWGFKTPTMTKTERIEKIPSNLEADKSGYNILIYHSLGASTTVGDISQNPNVLFICIAPYAEYHVDENYFIIPEWDYERILEHKDVLIKLWVMWKVGLDARQIKLFLS